MDRTASLKRTTSETDISLTLSLDGSGQADIATGIGFLDHMLTALARHGLFDLTVRAKGDLHIDFHHTTEDVGIVLGQAFAQALGDKRGISRFGHALVPMDEALAEAAIDISGRPFLAWDVAFERPKIGEMDTELFEEFFRALAMNALITLHVTRRAGRNAHHVAEACFKATARALRMAARARPARRRRDPVHQGGAVKFWTAPSCAQDAAPVLVREGFAWGALMFGPLWLAAHRAWIAAALALAAAVLIVFLTGAGTAAACARDAGCAARPVRPGPAPLVAGPAGLSRWPRSSRRATPNWRRWGSCWTRRPDLGRRVPAAAGRAMKVAVVDYGSGNLASASRALALAAERAGLAAEVTVTADPDYVAAPTGSCCPARAPSPTARAAWPRSRACARRSRPRPAAARRSSASASACS